MSTIKILNDNNSFSDITRKDKYALHSKLNNYLTGLHNLKKDIKESESPDDFLSLYDNKSCDTCVTNKSMCNKTKYFIDHDGAINRLFTFHNGTFGKILSKFHELDFDILLGGSSGLAAVLKKTHTMKGYEPKDMDIYLKDITDLKITQINQKINEIFPVETYKIVIIRRLLTLTWWIFDTKDTDNVMEIQLNMLNARSWADVFVVYHSDVVCVGYDIKKRQLITQTQRWNNFVSSFPNVYVTNLNSHDQPETLEIARQKYSNRGFAITALLVYKNIEDKNKKTNGNNEIIDPYGFSGNNEYSKTETDLINKLSTTYGNCSDIIISDDIVHMYDRDGSFPPIVDIDDIDKETNFNKFVAEFEYPDGVECPVIFEKHNIMIANSSCMHDVSLKSYILMKKFKQCPLCRKNFVPVMYNALKINRDDAIKKYNTMSKVNKYKNIHTNKSDSYFGNRVKKPVKSEDEEVDFDGIGDIVEEYEIEAGEEEEEEEGEAEAEAEAEAETEAEEESVKPRQFVPREPREPRQPRQPRHFVPRESRDLMSPIPIGMSESMDDLDQMSNSEIEQITWAVSSSATWNQPAVLTSLSTTNWNQPIAEWGSDGETIPWSNGLNSSVEANKTIVPARHDEDKVDNKKINSLIKIFESSVPLENNKKNKITKPILEEIDVEENIVEQAEAAWTEVKPRRKRHDKTKNEKHHQEQSSVTERNLLRPTEIKKYAPKKY
ncbi:MAG: hypothetical protein Terrestrivirus2_121 [Terrestrivirus sp.]|uniref:Uncharacterized protein n=1 Tax=Terrestrivirus sp. TaxID=2487775 RepID=A0A3G4ZPT0_9VIRU|nr:MAG: hypothetical protein Terrestrivirus2_121 [Terrestrivirus sp.]